MGAGAFRADARSGTAAQAAGSLHAVAPGGSAASAQHVPMGPVAPFDHSLGSIPDPGLLASLSATPTIEGSITYDMIWANGFTSFASVTFTIRQSPDGTVLASGMKPTDGGGNAQFNRWQGDHNVDLAVGMQITATDGLTTKDLTLVPMSVTTVNTTTNVVSGTAPSSSPVHVDVGGGTSWTGKDTTADGTGHWSANFSPLQITAQMQAIAKVSDADGDMTSAGAQPARIDGSLTQDNISANGFAPNATITFTILDSPGGKELASGTKQADSAGNAQFNRWQDHMTDLAPGMQLTASDGTTTKELTLATLAVTLVDPATDDVSGTAPAGTQVQVNLNEPGKWANGQATADVSGRWTVDFSGSFDITYMTNANASVADIDGDQTQASRGVAQIGASLTSDGVQAWSFLANGDVTFTIKESPSGAVLKEGTKQADDAGNVQFLFPQDHSIDLIPGMQVTVTDGTTTKGVTLAGVAISSIDAATNVVTGTAPADAKVQVSISNAWGVSPKEATAGVTGHWSVDFTGTFDINFQTRVSASVRDADGDWTSAERSPAWIEAWLTGDNVNANGFAANSTVTLTIYASAGGDVLASADKPTDGQGNTQFNRPQDHDVDLAPGMLVTVTDGTVAKGLTLVGVTVDSIDVANDVVTGTAPADSDVQVGVNDSMGGGWGQQVTADADGSWSADFSGLWDITYGTYAGAQVRDGDGDATTAGMQPATIDASPTWDGISANNFAANATVTFTILDSPGGTTLTSGTKQTDNAGSAQFNRYDDHDIDLVPGMEIVVTDGTVTKELTLAALSITSIDASTDVVTGIAPPSSDVQVNVNDPPSGGWGMQVTADGSGNWTADFAGMYDVTYTTRANASVPDEDGDRTSVGKQPAQIFVGLNGDNISGRGFAADATVDFAILESPGGAELATGSGPTDSQGNVELGRWNDFDVDLAPGMQVTVTDGTTTKQVTLVDVAIDFVDPASDTVSGTAPAATDVQVNVDDENSGSNLETTADGTGHWSVDFTDSFDIRYSTGASAQVRDEDGDATTYNKSPARIHVGLTGGGINAEGFAGNADVSFTIYESSGGDELATGSKASDADGNVQFEPWNDFDLDLAPGMQVVVTDGTLTKELTLVAVAITSVDPATDVVSGTAPAGVQLGVGIGDGQNGTGGMTAADGSGHWSVDFSPFDVTYSMWANAQVSDDDGDTTDTDHGPTTIDVSLTGDVISANNFAAGADVNFTIESSLGAVLETGSSTSDSQGNVQFNRGNDFDVDLLPGMNVTVSDGTTTKQLTLADVGITLVDPSTDTISGTAAPGTEIRVDVGVDQNNAQQTTTADGSGTWSIDFSPFDITYTMWAHAQVSDDDGDTTQAEGGPTTIDVSLTWDVISGNNFAANTDVTFTIESSGGTLLAGDSRTSDSQGYVEFDRGDAFDIDLLPGMHVTVSDGITTKQLTLAALGISLVDPSTDTISGTAAPGADVAVGVTGEGDGAGDMRTADGSGHWSIDFSPFDITYSTNAHASVGDDDGDTTSADKNAPQIWANLVYDNISAQGFAGGASISFTIAQTPGGTVLDSGSGTGDAAGNVDFWRGDAFEVDLLPGMEVTVSDGTTTKRLTLTALGITYVDPSTDTISGTAPAGTEVQVDVGDGQNGTSQTTTADVSSHWSIHVSQFHISYWTNATARTGDGDGDQTAFDKAPPHVDVVLTSDGIFAGGFANNASVSFTISQSPGGAELASGSKTSDAGGRVQFVRGDAFTVDLAPGMQVTVTDGTLTKNLTLAALAVTSVDPVTDTVSGTAPPNAHVHVGVGDTNEFNKGEVGQEVTADGAGHWSVDFSPFDITATKIVSAGVDDSDSDTTWAQQGMDTIPPVATITSGPSGLTNDSTPTFSFSANEPSTFECKVDSGSWTACTSPHTTPTLSEGAHTFQVRATDTAHNLGAATSRSFTVDTVAPLTTIDSGPSGPTNDSTPAFAFSAGEPVVFECRVDSSAWAVCTSPYTSGVLADGPHTFEARATDAANNHGAAASRSFTVDTVAPQTTIDSGPTGVTTDSTPTFEFSSELGATFECRVDSGVFAACSSPHTTPSLGDGAHTFEVRAVDSAGNPDATPASRSFTVDTAPETTITSGPSGLTNDTTPTFAFSASEPSTFECQVDSGGWATCTSPFTTAALADGAHTFQVRATDGIGNVDPTPAGRDFTVHTGVPATTITSGPPTLTNDTTPTFAFSADEAATFQCRFDSGSWSACSSPYTAGTLVDGAHTFQVRAIDTAGNVDQTPASHGFTVHTGVPATTINSGSSALTNDATPTFAFSADEAATFQCRIDSAGWTACSSPYTTAALADGSHTFEVRATDTAGNVDATPASSSFRVDTAAPQTSIDSGPTGTTTDSTPTFAFSASETGGSFQCRLDGAAFAACTSPYTTPVLSSGTHSLEVRAIDAAGNVDPTPAARGFTVMSAKASLAIVSKSATVSRTRVATFKLRCGTPIACRGTLSLSATVKGSLVHSQRRFVVVKLGSAKFAVAAGHTVTVKVKLPLAGHKLLLRVKRLPATARVRYAQPDGSTTTGVRTVTLRAPARR